MDGTNFLAACRKLVADYADSHLDKGDNAGISADDVYVVWSCKILQNNKALLSTPLPDGMYYEITFNGDRHEFYVDAYKKLDNKCIKLEDLGK